MDLGKYRSSLITFVRQREERSCGGNAEHLADLAGLSDSYLLNRWLWTVVIISVLVSFVGLPLILSILHPFLPPELYLALWYVTELAMALTFVGFVSLVTIALRGER